MQGELENESRQTLFSSVLTLSSVTVNASLLIWLTDLKGKNLHIVTYTIYASKTKNKSLNVAEYVEWRLKNRTAQVTQRSTLK